MHVGTGGSAGGAFLENSGHSFQSRPFRPHAIASTAGNPGGSPEATRRAFNKHFLTDLAQDWQQHGRKVLERVRRESPASYLKVCAARPSKSDDRPAFLADAQDAPQLSPTFPTQTVVCTGDTQNTAEWVVRCAKLWNAESPTRRLTRNGSGSYAPWWRQF